MLLVGAVATLPHSKGALDDLLGSASMIFSKYLCAPLEPQQDGVAGCASGGSYEWDALRLPPNTSLLIYGPSLIREIAQLLLHAEQSSSDASITLVSSDAATDPSSAAVECFCGTTFVECSSCYDIAAWELGQNRRITYVTNYRQLQLPSGLDDLNRWIGEQHFTIAAVMGPHIPEYYGEETPGTRVIREVGATPGNVTRSMSERQTTSWADQMWDVFSSHFEPRKLIHVSPWFGSRAALALVEWPPPGDEAGVKATTFNTTEELGSACGAGLDVVTPHSSNEEFLGVPCNSGEMHQCIFVCERSAGAAPNNCKATPFVHMTQRFVELVRQCVGTAETASADLIRRDRGHYTYALETGSDSLL